ncbi:Endoplasmic reticulum vesicle transporter, C-terminal [Artemisia annua]|uniref:Endoplasmic reticulum vesicle transporter, C-terminal n=1 Tax=Artemisia annua TaxID=35608 RepID=A0A2U1PAF5_ARTAN|nr:Endoplasmic reticulum vesicle transporter, C-terminal [Artemisia annua]
MLKSQFHDSSWTHSNIDINNDQNPEDINSFAGRWQLKVETIKVHISVMVLTSKIKSVDFFRKIPRDLTEASLSGAGLSLVAAFSMMFLFGMELHNYLDITTTISVIVDQSSDSDFLLIGFNFSFPALSCEFASVDVSDVSGTVTFIALLLLIACDPQLISVLCCKMNRLNITKIVRKYSINKHLESTSPEFDPVPVSTIIKHDDKVDEEYGEGSITLNSQYFDKIAHQYSILAVNFYAPWCDWCNRLYCQTNVRFTAKNKNATCIELGHMLLVNWVILSELAHLNYGYMFILTPLFINNFFVVYIRNPHGRKQPKSLEKVNGIYFRVLSYLLVCTRHNLETDGRIILGKVDCTEERDLCKSHHVQAYPSIRIFHRGSDIRPAPREAGCRIEGFVRVKKVPGSIIVSAHSESHSFDASQINMSHVISSFNFGKKVIPKTMNDLKRLRHYIESHDKLAGKSYMNVEDRANVTIEHYLQVVKTEVMSSFYQLIEDYEYTAHSSLVHALTIPVAKFHFEPSPMQILVTEDPKSFSHFITNVCAIIGGVFTVAGIFDSLLHNTMRLVKKFELGKTF